MWMRSSIHTNGVVPVMNNLNYHHLLYFWSVARSGNLALASEELSVTPQTISGQIRTFEVALGERLFDRRHRRLELTDFGRKVFEHAQSIFSLGRELQAFLSGDRTDQAPDLAVGIANALPKFVVYRILEPAMRFEHPPHFVCHVGKAERLLARLALHDFDVVLSDVPIPPNVSVRAYNHLLGKCDVVLMGSPEMAERYRPEFPQGLDGAPFLLPTRDTALRKSLDSWFRRQSISPKIVAEHEDSALLKAFGERGLGIYPIPSVVSREVQLHYGAEILGTLDGIDEKFYAITIERNFQHPAVSAICHEAREVFFGQEA